jgi:hypothetical protein
MGEKAEFVRLFLVTIVHLYTEHTKNVPIHKRQYVIDKPDTVEIANRLIYLCEKIGVLRQNI